MCFLTSQDGCPFPRFDNSVIPLTTVKKLSIGLLLTTQHNGRTESPAQRVKSFMTRNYIVRTYKLSILPFRSSLERITHTVKVALSNLAGVIFHSQNLAAHHTNPNIGKPPLFHTLLPLLSQSILCTTRPAEAYAQNKAFLFVPIPSLLVVNSLRKPLITFLIKVF